MYVIHVPDMKCGGCLGAVTRAIRTVDEAARVEADLERREIRVSSGETEAAILQVVREAGYQAEPTSAPAL
ncbi:heavy-metal-associated domain-containing protein [Microvirga subterranea]|uniref:Copper chaperone n=1 Tax=Microvirga subterranea TaxID=186651 RepID=A0A370HTQ9_9HYPH|nr:heavy-metal-associated domain-containing protein [Microvirga subterranea]RDI61909.1 copper chaperone [Microvirga subterranea]